MQVLGSKLTCWDYTTTGCITEPHLRVDLDTHEDPFLVAKDLESRWLFELPISQTAFPPS
jgi:hypothetical protein